MRKAILHIGLEKTGSTSLQEFLYINRRRLLDQYRIWVPDYLGRGSQWLLAVLAYDPSREDDLTNILGNPAARMAKLDEIHKKITYSANHQQANLFCFSSEHLSSRLVSVENICRLRDFFIGIFDDVEVVVYVREPIRMAISRQSTAVKLGYCTLGLPKPSEMVHLLDFKAVIQRWESVFGESLTVRLYDDGSSEFDVISDFQSLLGISSTIDSKMIRPPRINSSLGWSELRLMSGINAVAQEQVGRPLPAKVLQGIVNALEGACLANNLQIKPFWPSAHEQESYRLYFSDQSEWLFSKYFPDRECQWTSASSDASIPVRDEEVAGLSSSENMLCQVLVALLSSSTLALEEIAEHLSLIAWKIEQKELLTLYDQEISERFSDEIKLALSKDPFASK